MNLFYCFLCRLALETKNFSRQINAASKEPSTTPFIITLIGDTHAGKTTLVKSLLMDQDFDVMQVILGDEGTEEKKDFEGTSANVCLFSTNASTIGEEPTDGISDLPIVELKVQHKAKDQKQTRQKENDTDSSSNSEDEDDGEDKLIFSIKMPEHEEENEEDTNFTKESAEEIKQQITESKEFKIMAENFNPVGIKDKPQNSQFLHDTSDETIKDHQESIESKKQEDIDKENKQQNNTDTQMSKEEKDLLKDLESLSLEPPATDSNNGIRTPSLKPKSNSKATVYVHFS